MKTEKEHWPPRFLEEMVLRHVRVGRPKPLSYLPIRTIECVLRMGVSEYQSLIAKAGNSSLVFHPDRCCILSGAVYAFSAADLDAVLKHNARLLSQFGWPVNPQGFVEKIAAEWLNEEHPVLPVIRRAFGDSSR